MPLTIGRVTILMMMESIDTEPAGDRLAVPAVGVGLREARGGHRFWNRYGLSCRHSGMGQPLQGTSWLNRPSYAGWMLGGMFGDDVIGGRVDQGNDFFWGYLLGRDFDHMWGLQLRLGWSAIDISDAQNPPRPRSSDLFVGDVSVLYYPWGDTRWRPYILAGLGPS